MRCLMILPMLVLQLVPHAGANPSGSGTSPATATTTATAPAKTAAAEKFQVEASIRLDGAVLGTPSLTVAAGKPFSVQLGKEGEQRVTITGMAAPINERSLALDFTLELEQWGKLGIASRRVSQTVKLAPGERYVVDGIKDQDGKSFGMDVSVRPVTTGS